MPQLRNTQTGETFDVSDVDAVRMAQADPSLQIVGDVATSAGPDVRKTAIARSSTDAQNRAGVTVAGADERAAHSHAEYLKDKTSTIGAAVRGGLGALTFGATDYLADPETLQADELHHELARGVGTAVGLGATLAFGNDLGVAKLFGSGSRAAQELAVAGDALTAEHVGSTLSSKVLLGGVSGELNAGERALARAGRALDEGTAARAGIENIPQDLIGLDEAGLKRAALEERASLKAQAAEERGSLEELRKPQREELANEIRDMHHELEAERPVFKSVNGADVEAIEGVKDIKVQLAKSYKSMRAGLDSPLSVARDPSAMIRPLEMRQAALEALQAKAPEIQSVLGSDARAVGLEHVDDALMQTKEQIAAIRRLDSRANPVTSGRLAELDAGISPRLTAIEAAREALKVAPEVGLVQKGMKAGVFAAGTALAHAIPGVGIMAPFAGKWASDAIGKAFEHLAGARTAVAARSKAALGTFLGLAKDAAPAAAITASRVLSSVRFGPSDDTTASTGNDLAGHYKARSAELRQQTMYGEGGQIQMRPEARQAVHDRLAPVFAVNPLLGDHLESLTVRKATYIAQMMPKRPDVGGLQIGPDNWKPSELEMRSWARTIRAVEDPGGVEERLAHGTITPEDAAAYRTVYPERFAQMQQAITMAAPQLSKTLPMQKKIALSIFTGVPVTPVLQPNVLAVLQATYVLEPGTAGGQQAPRPQPSFTAFGSTPSKDKTAAQRSEEP